MLGWQIFLHSVRLVFANLETAFRVSGILYLLYAGIQVGVLLRFGDALAVFEAGDVANLGGDFAFAQLMVVVVTIITTLWIAVGWHRFVLLDEVPQGWLPEWHGQQMFGYFGRSIMIGLILMIGMMMFMVPVGILGGENTILSPLFPIFAGMLGAYFLYRVALILPAIALGKPISLKTAWEATKGQSGTIVALVIVTAVANGILQIPNWVSGDPSSLISLIYTLVVGWFMMLIAVSVLTTFYGHFVEGRAIG